VGPSYLFLILAWILEEREEIGVNEKKVAATMDFIMGQDSS